MKQQYPSIIGIGLGGDERVAASEPFREMYAEAAAAGLRLTNHAGETTGPEAIWEALAIGSERLGHALSAIRAPELLAELKKRQIPLELNPELECADRGLRVVCGASSARVSRPGVDGHAEFGRSGVLWLVG